jgi:hydrogenase maturation protease
MSIKIIALGNVLMKDDGIGCEVLKLIEKDLSKEKNYHKFEFIYGETDISYCINSVINDDQLFIIDASYFKKNPGDITMYQINSFNSNKKIYSQHSYNFIDLLRIYYPNVKGYIYAIEIAEVGYGMGISKALNDKIESISTEIKESILDMIGERSSDEIWQKV